MGLALSGMPLLAGAGLGQPIRLRCEYQDQPIAIDTPHPQLSWILTSASRDQRQNAYRILVATTRKVLDQNRADLWDSGIVSSSQSAQITYDGPPLRSGQRYYWKVQVWDQANRRSAWSAPALWETAVLDPGEWKAQWIGAGPAREPRPAAGFFKSTNELAEVSQPVVVDEPSVLLRKEFILAGPVRRARAYVTGLGYYEFSCNGRRVGDHVLAPAKTNYRRWVLYDTYDLTTMLKPGRNALGLALGNGWFNPTMKWWEPYRMQWFGSKRALLQLHLDYRDGSTETIVTDGSWKTAPGPVRSACIYDGEVYDATRETPGWDSPGFQDYGWQAAQIVEPPGGALVSCPMPPIRVVRELQPVALHNPQPGVFVYDLGQNISGWARLTTSGPPGTRVTLRYAEDIHPNGTLDPRSNERAQATDVYILNGRGREDYEPHFTYHGFQFVEVTGLTRPPRLDDVRGCVVQSDCAQTGSWACDQDLLNRIHRATVWSQRGALMGYPLDCPQRDERLGWLGDAMVTMEEALFNFDATTFYRHWLDGIRRNQNPANGDISIVSPRPYVPDEPDPTWSSAYPFLCWEFYRHHGDRHFLAEQFDAICRYVDYLGTQASNHVLPRYWIGDWGSTVKGWQEGDPPLVTTACYYLDAVIASKAARVLGRTREAEHYDTLARQIRSAFRRAYYDPQKGQFNPGTQFSNAFPLVLGLADEAEQGRVLHHILQDLGRQGGHFDVGVLGAKFLIDALTQFGRADVAFQLASQTGYPSWAQLLEGGRTTLSEFWDLHGSHNHVMLGSIDAWFYRTLAGIQIDESQPGFEHVLIQPFFPASLKTVNAKVETVRGPIAVTWKRSAGLVQMHVRIPANCTATVRVPATPDEHVRSIPHRPAIRAEEGAAIFEVGSGHYEFRVIPKRR
jgi:alpha-L-rhamnosidase